jgi:histidinol-phosphate aminotransferase
MRFRKNIIEMKPYKVPAQLPPVRLDKNESPFDVPDYIKERVFKHFTTNNFNRYPEIDSKSLREKIAQKMEVSENTVFVSNGGDALIPEIISLFDGEEIVTFPPTFSMYTFYASRMGLKTVEIPLDQSFNIPGNLAFDTDKTSLIIICSPNNPTGNDIPVERIRAILELKIPVLLDQAYVEFSEKDYRFLLKEYDNLIILRTFSKAFGLSGLRVGYAITSDRIAQEFRKAHSPFSLNSFSSQIACEMIEERALMSNQVAFIVEERARFYEEFKALIPVQSSANFLLLKVDCYDYLLERGVATRKFNGAMSDFIRVTIGSFEENELVKRLLKRFLSKNNTWIH